MLAASRAQARSHETSAGECTEYIDYQQTCKTHGFLQVDVCKMIQSGDLEGALPAQISHCVLQVCTAQPARTLSAAITARKSATACHILLSAMRLTLDLAITVQGLQQRSLCLYRRFEQGTDKMRQCCTCQEVFCSLCSVPDYEQHDVRYFCLDCKGL